MGSLGELFRKFTLIKPLGFSKLGKSSEDFINKK